jgi:hypothetical protein
MISRRSRKAGVVIETILILAGLGLLAKGGMTGTSAFRFSHAAETMETTGTVTGTGNYGFKFYVQFSPAADQTVGFAQDCLPLYHMGDEVPVIFDPASPYHAAINRIAAIWFDAVAFSLGGFILAGFGFRLRGRRSI